MEKAVNNPIVVLFSVIVVFLSFVDVVSAQNNPLNRRIDLSVTNSTVKNTLKIVGEIINFNFSYNSEIIDNSKTITINVTNSTLESVLKTIFDEEIQYKVVGNHVVLLQKEKKKNKSVENSGYSITGYIIDSSTDKIIHSATIYDIDGKRTCITNTDGYYSISIPANKEYSRLNYCKRGYMDTVIIIKPAEFNNIDIRLQPLKNPYNKIPIKEMPSLSTPFDQQRIVNRVVPPEVLSHSRNLTLYEKRIGQISFLPLPGVHSSVNGVVVNNMSFNVLAGFSNGVEGAEIGGLLNIDKSYVKGIQLGGFGNIVGEKTSGVQIAGFFNVNVGSMTGVQIAGFNNIVNDTVTGAQIAGFTNLLRGRMNGVQVAGFHNHATKDVDGFQVSGFTNIAHKDVDGGQISGFINVSGRNVNGMQIAGFINYAAKNNDGVQISGFLNKAKAVKGFQIGFINVSDTSTGYSIGFFNHVRKGYRAIELSCDEIFYGNVTYKTGNRKLYNIFNFGMQSVNNKIWSMGFGLGSYFNINEKLTTSIDLSTNFINENIEMESPLNLLNKLSISLDYKISQRFTAFLAPSYNVHVSSLKDINTNSFSTDIALNPFYEQSNSATQTQMWAGGKIGIQMILSKN